MTLGDRIVRRSPALSHDTREGDVLMSKPTITRLFVGGLTAVVAGAILIVAAVIAAFASNVFEVDGHDIVGVRSSGVAWSLLGLAIVSAIAMAGGAIAGLVSWIGALLNTAQLQDKTWFILLLVLGLFSFGLIAMIAYVIAGPDAIERPGGINVRATWSAPRP
jgi:hypothetical protein